MTTTVGNLYKVEYQITLLNPKNQTGPNNQYRKPITEALVIASSPHVVGAILTSDLSLNASEQIEIISAEQVAYGNGSIYS